MNQQSYKMLCDDLEQVASQIIEGAQEPCQFEDEPETVEYMQEFNQVWEDRS